MLTSKGALIEPWRSQYQVGGSPNNGSHATDRTAAGSTSLQIARSRSSTPAPDHLLKTPAIPPDRVARHLLSTLDSRIAGTSSRNPDQNIRRHAVDTFSRRQDLGRSHGHALSIHSALVVPCLYDPTQAKFSPGLSLLLEICRTASQYGIRTIERTRVRRRALQTWRCK